jgi:hypothetical protein
MKQQRKFESRMIITTTGCLPSSSSSSSSPSGETGLVMMYNLDIGVDDGCWVGRGKGVMNSSLGLGMPVSMIDAGGESKFEFRRMVITTKGFVMIICTTTGILVPMLEKQKSDGSDQFGVGDACRCR